MNSGEIVETRGVVSPTAALVVAVFAISWAGPLVRFAEAPALSISAWRLLLSVALIAIVLAVRRPAVPRLVGRDWVLAGVAGVFLALHFWSWIASLSLTTVSSSVVLVSMQPVFVAVLSGALLGERATRRQWAGIAVAVGGAIIIAWGDFGIGGRALFGDALALVGALFVSIYYVIGRRLRPQMDLWWYIFLIYGIAALVLVLAIALVAGVPLTGFPQQDWLIFAALAAGPMMLGHTGVNYALKYVRAYVANIALLMEPIGATLIAWILPGIREVPGLQTAVGGALILAGIAVTVVKRRQPGGPEPA